MKKNIERCRDLPKQNATAIGMANMGAFQQQIGGIFGSLYLIPVT